MYPENWPQLYAATIHEWKFLLEKEEYKNVIIKSLQFLTENKRVRIYAFVIMSNHIHFIWQAENGYDLSNVQTSFKKYTSQQFLKLLENDSTNNEYASYAIDRKHRFWKRNSLGTELFSPAVLQQKIEYIHNNPVRARLCNFPEDYRYSSAVFYKTRKDEFNFLYSYE
jgi:putative transposase